MNEVRGRVTTDERGAGVPDLLVTLYLGSRREIKASGGQALGDHAVRFGSVGTDADGRFTFEYDDKRPQEDRDGVVVLVVTAPDSPGAEAVVLHQSAPRPVRAGASETFLVRLSEGVLQKAKITPPGAPSVARTTLDYVATEAAAIGEIDAGWRKIAAARVNQERKSLRQLHEEFLPAAVEEIRMTSTDVARPGLLATDDASIESAAATMIDKGIRAMNVADQTVDGVRRRTRFFLTAEQRQALDSMLDPNDPVLTRDALYSLLQTGEGNGEGPVPTWLARSEDSLENLTPSTFEERCGKKFLDLATGADDAGTGQESGSSGESDLPLTGGDILKLAASVTADIDAPAVVLGARPGQDDVIRNIRDFALDPGPADSPAFFDFHSLRIAFDDVWQQVLDERIEPLVSEAYTLTRRLGGDLHHPLHAGKPTLKVLADEIGLVSAAGLGGPGAVAFRPRPPGTLPDLGRRAAAPDLPPRPPLPPGNPSPDGIDAPDLLPAADVYATTPPRARELLDRLHQILRGPHSFTAFGASKKSRAVNFGLVVTYRQRWEPVSYQVGELVKTVTLAPGESQKYTRTTKIRRSRAEKEVDKRSSLLREESKETSRAESVIVRKANAKTNFELTSEGSYNFGLASGDATTTASHDAEAASEQTKKSFREAVMKAAQEYKQERSVEVSTENSIETTQERTGEIRNPNDELPVTYLFFDLQRRFRVTEQIHRVTPVVLVAQEIPKPNHIDAGFLVEHDWILRRVLLDDSFEPALVYLSTRLEGDKVALRALAKNLEIHRALVQNLQRDLSSMQEQAGRRYEALERAVSARIGEDAAEEGDSFFSDLGQALGLGEGQTPEAARAREEAARDAERRAVEKVKDLAMRLQREVTSLNEATERYTTAVRDHKNQLVQIARLQVHVKQNILHYMQAIWAHEVPDQRFLRHYQTPVPDFTDLGTSYRFLGDVDLERVEVDDTEVVTRTAVEFEVVPQIGLAGTKRALSEVADADSLLGFKGNYMIFPLKESNGLTELMTTPYVDAGFRLLDPHEPGNMSRQDFARYICRLHDQLSETQFEEVKPALREQFRRLLLSPAHAGDEIVVSTDSLYIEALPGSSPLLEDFKLAHRAFDVVSAQEQAREASIENLRLAARLVDGNLEDPTIDKLIRVDGAAKPEVNL